MKPRLFLDTNIVLDLLIERHPFYEPIAKLATLADTGHIVLVVSSLTFATANYFITKFEDATIAKQKLKKFRVLCEISDLTASIVDKGFLSDFKDFEDALQYFSAQNTECNFLITRNIKHFRQSAIPVFTVEEYLKIHNA